MLPRSSYRFLYLTILVTSSALDPAGSPSTSPASTPAAANTWAMLWPSTALDFFPRAWPADRPASPGIFHDTPYHVVDQIQPDHHSRAMTLARLQTGPNSILVVNYLNE